MAGGVVVRPLPGNPVVSRFKSGGAGIYIALGPTRAVAASAGGDSADGQPFGGGVYTTTGPDDEV